MLLAHLPKSVRLSSHLLYKTLEKAGPKGPFSMRADEKMGPMGSCFTGGELHVPFLKGYIDIQVSQTCQYVLL